jgi:hypothetical protein
VRIRSLNDWDALGDEEELIDWLGELVGLLDPVPASVSAMTLAAFGASFEVPPGSSQPPPRGR